MSIRGLQERFLKARGDRYRRDIVEIAVGLPGAPDYIGDRDLLNIECRFQRPPGDGRVLMALAAALGIEPLVVLRELGYWPPIPSPLTTPLPDQLLAEAARIAGWRVTNSGGRIIIEKGPG